jgi:hypothetical protein
MLVCMLEILYNNRDIKAEQYFLDMEQVNYVTI